MTSIQYDDALYYTSNYIAVTVTYSDRWKHLLQVIPAVFQQASIDQLIIVDNASSYDLKANLRATFPIYSDRILVLTQTENLGSAGGFSIGLKKAYELNAEFVYLLDDDNLPEPNAVSILLKEWAQISTEKPIALLSYRYRNLPNLQKAAHGQEVRYFHDKPNSFLGFSLESMLLKKGNKSLLTASDLLPKVSIFQAPYGGLFLPRATIKAIGFPNEQLFLYADDTEYTYRIIKQGGSIWMITDSRLQDLETSWWSDSRVLKKRWSEPLLEEGGFKVYYSTRNLTWFLWKNLSPNPVLFFINGLVYLGYLLVKALLTGKLGAYGIILVAVKDGVLGRLGRKKEMEG
jgi:GT2 family glycosyltransferase